MTTQLLLISADGLLLLVGLYLLIKGLYELRRKHAREIAEGEKEDRIEYCPVCKDWTEHTTNKKGLKCKACGKEHKKDG